ncbi:MAG: hypothetical protein L0Y54_02560 [Sporichthyaceae bacterium]|nr:hypothetical protein [Sporichthyaceae bacterium]
MTKKITVSLPDDVAERLEHEDNASAYVADAIRRRMAAETARAQLEAAGFAITDEGLKAAEAEYAAALASISPEQRAHAEALSAEVRRARRWG